jgi:spore germination protein KA
MKPSPIPLYDTLNQNLAHLRTAFDGTSDLVIRSVQAGGRAAAVITMEGMVQLQMYIQGVLRPMLERSYAPCSASDQLRQMGDCILALADQMEVRDFDLLERLIMSGFCVILLDGTATGLAVGMQGYNFRSVGEPSGETVQRGSREGFVEVIRINLAMVRRRMKTPKLRFEMLQAGTLSRTDIALCYLDGVVSPRILAEVRRKLQDCPLSSVLESGYLQPFLEERPALFSTVSTSERPDTVCGKISEGRIAVFVDGTPDVLIVPCLFTEHFQSMDDYANRAFFATFTRWLKYSAFFVSVLLPGLFVAVGTWLPSFFPSDILYRVARSEANQPFSLMVQALLIHLIYELMREAGLRLPKPIGHAVSILGGLVIGDAAVQSGLIGAPMILIVALTAISSFVIPQLYEPVAVLRLGFIVLGGTLSVYGVVLGFCALVAHLCALSSCGVPYTAPLSPPDFRALRDVVIRAGWPRLGRRSMRIQNLPGTREEDA